MKKNVAYLFVFLLAFSCKKDEEKIFPIEPYIEFKSLTFKTGSPIPDSLTLKFNFRDGDSDLGFTSNIVAPYNFRNYFFKSDGKIFSNSLYAVDLNTLITYRDKRLGSNDTLPKFTTPYDCTNWELFRDSRGILDTVYYQQNLNYFNIYVDFYSLNNSGWIKFDPKSYFIYPNCSSLGFYTRSNFQIEQDVDAPFEVVYTSSKEGIFTYKMISIGFRQIFSGKKIKLKIRIQDRALHKSNEIETSEIQL